MSAAAPGIDPEARPPALLGSLAERVRDGAAVRRDLQDKAQVCVVGTGPGGATLASELARAGHSVILLEEGAYRTGAGFTGVAREMAPLVHRDAVATARGARLPIALGVAVGGSSAISYGTCERPPRAVLEEWSRVLGAGTAAPAELEPYFAELERELGVAPAADGVVGAQAAAIERGAARLDRPATRIERAARGCLATGVCGLGCPQDAVRGMHLTYVPHALASGAVLYTRCRAEELLAANGRVFGVAARFLDAAGRPTPHRLRVVSERVVLACGALLTPAFLQRAGIEGGEGGLGRHLRLHPAVRVVGRFDEEIAAFEEVPQSVALRGLAPEGLLIQSQFLPPSALAVALAGLGDAHERAMAAYARLAMLEVAVCEDAEGSVRAGRGAFPTVRQELEPADCARLLRGIAYAAEVLFAAGAVEVYTGVRPRPVLASAADAAQLAQEIVRPSDLALTALHPMGTARMSDDPRRGVTSATGRVHGSRQLYVSDASLFPGSPRAHPMLTVAALGLRLGAEMSAHLGAPL